MKYPPDGLRYGSERDWELTRQDEERCEQLHRQIRKHKMPIFWFAVTGLLAIAYLAAILGRFV